MKTYKVIRMFRNDSTKNHVVKTGLTLEEAQAWCKHKETSSSTCTSPYKKALTRKAGPWFDGYEEDK